MVFNLNHLTKLYIYFVKNINMKVIYDNIKKNSSLKSLTFRKSPHDVVDKTVKYLDCIVNQFKLSQLSLANFSLSWKVLPKEMDLKILELDNIKLNNTLELINLNPNLEKLTLLNLIAPLKLFSSLIKFKSLVSLKLKNLIIDSSETDDILNLIKTNDSITSLVFECEKIKFKQGELSKALNEKHTLKSLVISAWDMGYSFLNNTLEDLLIYHYLFNLEDLKKFLDDVKESNLKSL